MRILVDPKSSNEHLPCSACRVDLDRPVAEMADVPALLGCSDSPARDGDRFVSFRVYACAECGLIQTDAAFDAQAYEIVHSHAVGGVWDEHHKTLAAFVTEALGGNRRAVAHVLEIGPSINPVVRELELSGARVHYVDAMPEPPVTLREHERYLRGVFPDIAAEQDWDLIVASHVAEHATSLLGFLKGIAGRLTPSGLAVLSIPDFHEWFKKRYWNAITSEHLNYPFAQQIHELCARLRLSVEFQWFRGHSLFMALRNGPSAAPVAVNAWDVRREAETLLRGWVGDIQETVARAERAVRNSDRNVVVAGASHLAQYLTLMSAPIASRACCVIDNAASKHGARLYGTGLTVRAFDAVCDIERPLVIIPSSPYQEEMTRQVLSLNPAAKVVG